MGEHGRSETAEGAEGADAGTIRVGVLGPTIVQADGETVRLRPRERAVIAALALHHPSPATTGDIVATLWPDDPPPTARKAVQNHVVRIRRAAPVDLIGTGDDGYRFGASVILDTDELLAAMRAARQATDARDHERSTATLLAALDSVRGEPFLDLPADGVADGTAARFEEVIHEAEDALAETRIASGDTARATNELTLLVEQTPLRERRWWLLMLAQYRSGRRRDALATFQRARRTLADLAGLEPGDDLRRLERLVADDDPSLLAGAILTPGSPADRGQLSDDFVGRESELAALHGLLDDARRGGSHLVSLEGEAGIGKTTLARVFASQAAGSGVRVVWGTCDEDPGRPLQPFARALEELAAASGSGFARWLPPDPSPLGLLAPALAERLPGVHSPSDPGRHRVHDAVRHVLTAAATSEPLVLVVDDLQYAPPATRRMVIDCLDPGVSLMIVTTVRTPSIIDFPPDVPTTRLTVPGLTREEVEQYLRGRRTSLEDLATVTEWLTRQTGGNPLLIRELAHGAPFDVPFGVHELHRPVPDLVRDALLARLDDLASDTRRVLEVAAVLGTRFRPEDLAAVTLGPARAIDEAIRAGILRPARDPDEMEFAHEMLRTLIYESLPEGTLAELHETAARVSAHHDADDDPSTATARHRLGAAALDPEGAVRSARLAARRALDTFAYEEAADLYRVAYETARRELTVSAAEECDLLIARGDALRRAGDPANVDILVDAAERATELGDGNLLARAALALCQLGPTTESGGSDQRAADIAERALEVVSEVNLAAQLAGAASLVYSMADDSQRCRTLFALAEREARIDADPHVLAKVLPYAYLGLGRAGDLDRRDAISVELERVGEEIGDTTTVWEALQLRLAVLIQRGDPELFAIHDRIKTLTATLREPSRDWALAYLSAAVAFVRSDLDAAEAHLTESLAYADAVSPSRVMAAYGGPLLGIRLVQGRLGELAETVAGLVADQPELPAWHAAMALVAADAADTARMRTEFDHLAADDFAGLPDDFTWTAAMVALGLAAARGGDADRSRLVHDRLADQSGLFSWFGSGTYGPIDAVLAETARACGDGALADRHEAAASAALATLRDAAPHS